MTIASELTALQTNLENAYDAVEAKGGTLPAAQNFDNLATAINNLPAGGDTITATNRTGSAIAVGDKVWLNKTTSQISTNSIASGYGKWLSIISPDGNYLIMNGYTNNTSNAEIYPRLYDISDPSNAYNTGALIQTDSSCYLYTLQFCYNSDGDLIAPFLGTTVGLKSSGGYWTSTYTFDSYNMPIRYAHLKDNLYAVASSYGGFYLVRLDSSTGSITQTSSRITTNSNRDYPVDGYFTSNKYFFNAPSTIGYQSRRYEITNESTLAVSYSDLGYKFASQTLGTEDGVWVMSCNAQGNSGNSAQTFTVYKPTDASTPAALSRFIGQYCWAAYNKKNKILTVVQWNSLNYGIFKYENGDFTELNYNLLEGINTSGKVLGGFITASEDLRRFAFALGGSNSNRGSFGDNTTYTTYVAERISTSTGWKIYKFDRQIVYDTTLTGFAETAGANGSDISVKTLLPEEINIDLLADKQNIEFIVE